eukprot:7176173-Karenia_brevis.AAC.1
MYVEDITDPKSRDYANYAEMSFVEILSKLEKLTRLCAVDLPTTETNIDTIITQHLIHHQAYNLVAPEIARFMIDTSVQLSSGTLSCDQTWLATPTG